MMLLSTMNFMRIVQRFELVGYITRAYGRAYHGRTTTAGPPFSDYPNDLVVPNTDASDLLIQDVGFELLKRERETKDSVLSEIPETAFAELLSEVDAEKCSIVQAADGHQEANASTRGMPQTPPQELIACKCRLTLLLKFSVAHVDVI
eukprot:3517260-Amphidinium_carterae.1